MRIIQELSDNIKEEIEDAHKYASRALELKDDNKEIADLYCTLDRLRISGHSGRRLRYRGLVGA